MGNLTSVTPTWVIPIPETYNVISTDAENMKKEFYLLSTTPVRRYQLTFTKITDTSFGILLDHYRDVSGTFQAFWWATVPTYIDGGDGSGVSIYGRWVGKPSWKPNARSWNVSVEFEKNI